VRRVLIFVKILTSGNDAVSNPDLYGTLNGIRIQEGESKDLKEIGRGLCEDFILVFVRRM
jgi:hypothetical protein